MEGPLFSSCFPIPIRMSSFRLEVVNHLSITRTSALSFCGSAHMKFTGSFLPVSQHMMHGFVTTPSAFSDTTCLGPRISHLSMHAHSSPRGS